MRLQHVAMLAHVARAPDVGDEVYRAFREDGYSPAAAAGVIGNFQQESSLNPQEEGGGLDQGQGDRYHPGSLQQQLDGIKGELNGTERGTREALRRAKSPREAALIFSERFERPGEPDNANRERYAEEALHKYGHLDLALGLGASSSPATTTGDSQQPTQDEGGQQAALADILRQALAPRPGSSVAGTVLARPQASGGAPGPRVPAPLQPVAPKPDVSSLLAAVAQLTPSAEAASPTEDTKSSAPSAPAAATGDASKGLTTPAGLRNFDGKRVAAWIAPALEYARSRGWKGEVTSGYRSKAEQERIYNSGVRPAAVPGTSNHEGDAFPRGAVDTTEAQQLSNILQGSPYAKLLVYAGSKDPVHFSHPHNGSY